MRAARRSVRRRSATARRRGGIAAVVGATALALAIGGLAGCGKANVGAGQLQGRAEAKASIDRQDLAFGDDVTLTLEVRSDPALEVELPHLTEIDGFRVLDSGTTRSESGGVQVERRWHRLRVERAGALTLPALETKYRPAATAGTAHGPAPGSAGASAGSPEWKTVSTAPIEIAARSRLPASDQPPQIREIKPLQPIHRARPWLWIAAAIVAVMALAAAIAWWLRRRRTGEGAVPQAPPIPAHEVALAALDRLAATEPVGDAAVRRFYFALSEIVRAYIEGRFGLNATDLTTEEILAVFDRLPLDEAQALGLRAFLRDTDRVKFASHRATRGESMALLDWSRRFVLETRPIEHEIADEASREAA